MNSSRIGFLIAAAVVVVLFLSSVFTVNERELAIKFRLGEIIKADYKPGLHFQTPFINNVRKFDKRILTLDARPANYLTKEKKNVNVDFFVKWRINDVSKYYTAMSGNERKAMERLYTTINEGLRGEFSNRSIQEVISGERAAIMNNVTKQANRQLGSFGIKVVDVRVKRIDFTATISESVYRRMEAERTRVAKDLRSRGAEAAEKIRAGADRQRTVILANAYKEAQDLRGSGDAKASEIYAKAYSKDQEFFSFYRSLNAYRSSMGRDGDVMVLEPDSEFFKYFKNARSNKR
ncbi:HflC protein [hydrothermal vent metagenome]|uniref:HflC protein n=1 Tax=hydrothermal vent metagenome TaxID=652676 RepID=A0A3B1BLY0_9ZZZZ